MTKARDARQDLVGGLRPLEPLGSLIREVDVAPDRRLEFPRAERKLSRLRVERASP